MTAKKKFWPLNKYKNKFLSSFHIQNTWGAWLIFILCLTATVWFWNFTKEETLERERTSFRLQSDQIMFLIEKRMLAYEQVLKGGRSLFKVNENITRSDWKTYILNIELMKNYPGILGIGFVKVIKPEELDRHIQEVRAEGYPDYKVLPDYKRDIYTSIVYLEPFEGRNLRAFGYDMFTEPERKRTMQQAMDEGIPSTTSKVKLVQETETDIQSGFLLYLPVYKNGMNISTVEARRKALLGFIYSPFRMNDLMEGIIGNHLDDIYVKIYYGKDRLSDSLMYVSPADERKLKTPNPLFTYTSSYVIDDRTWTFEFASLQRFENKVDTQKSVVVLLAGILISLLLFLSSMSLVGTRLANTRLENSLQEKDVLLKEIHHRVKNNMQIISSLLNLQMNHLHGKDEEMTKIFLDSQNRIKSMALIHEKLYQTTNMTCIDFGDYARDLVPRLFSTYKSVSGQVRLDISSEEIEISMDCAISLGLILNELVANAFKYAFKGNHRTEEKFIKVSVEKNTTCHRLIVEDNGNGFPENIDFSDSDSLGLQLVNTLTMQINGTISLEKNHGSKFIIDFPLKT